jgi:hypothetical protein
MARACEEVLLAAGRSDEAYRRYALTANRAGTHLATYRAIKKKYPDKAPREILDDLIAVTPDDPGRWFATAKELGFFDLAADLARRWTSPPCSARHGTISNRPRSSRWRQRPRPCTGSPAGSFTS